MNKINALNLKIFQSKGFSLIEFLVIIIIFGFLTTLGLLSFNGARCKTKENAARQYINNIKKECEASKSLKTEETFTKGSLEGYELIPDNLNNCFGRPEDQSTILKSKGGCNNLSFSYNFLNGKIKEFLEKKIDPTKFKSIKPKVSNSSCGGYPDPKYNGGNAGYWTGPHRAVDGENRFGWLCEGNHEITFDLGKEMTIEKLQIQNPSFGRGNIIEIYVDGKLVKKGRNWEDEEGRRIDWGHGLFQKTWYLENVHGRFITYKAVGMDNSTWCDWKYKMQKWATGCYRYGSEWTAIKEINVIAQ